MNDNVKPIIDAAAICSALGALLDYLPVIAAAASLVWTMIRIYETRTVQGWLGNRNDAI